MPRRSKGARLWLRKRRGRTAQWVILDHGREYRTGASENDLRAAENALAQYLANKRRPQFGDGHPSRVLIADALAEFGENHGPTTRRADLIGSAIVKLVDFFGDKTLSAITSVACNAYVRWRTQQVNARAKKNGRPIKEATARRELVVLGAALRWCWKEGKIDRLIPISLPSQPGPRQRHLNRSEVAALLAGALGWDRHGVRHRTKINRHLARFILIALYTGTRHDAILRLQWGPNTDGGWIDLASGVMYRRASDAVDKGKRRPPVPITPRLLPHLHRWRRSTTSRHRIRRTTYKLEGAEGVADRARTCRNLPDWVPRLRRMSYGTPALRCCCNSE
jgi:integrase